MLHAYSTSQYTYPHPSLSKSSSKLLSTVPPPTPGLAITTRRFCNSMLFIPLSVFHSVECLNIQASVSQYPILLCLPLYIFISTSLPVPFSRLLSTAPHPTPGLVEHQNRHTLVFPPALSPAKLRHIKRSNHVPDRTAPIACLLRSRWLRVDAEVSHGGVQRTVC